MQSRNDLVVGDQIFYRPNVLMEVVEVGGIAHDKFVNLIEVEYFERNNRVVDLEAIIKVPMNIAKTFLRKEKIKKSDNKQSRFLCDEDLVVGDQIFYLPKGDLLMEVIEVGGEILDRWVNLVDVAEFERNNRVTDGMNVTRVPLISANAFFRKK